MEETIKEVARRLPSDATIMIFEESAPLGISSAKDLLDEDEFFTSFDFDFRDWPVINEQTADDVTVLHVVDPRTEVH